MTTRFRRPQTEGSAALTELPRDKRESAVQQYQSLPDDRKKELTERSQRRDVVRPGQKQ